MRAVSNYAELVVQACKSGANAIVMGAVFAVWIATRGDAAIWLVMTKEDLLKGEIWRLFSPLLLPFGCRWYWMLFNVVMLYFLGRQIHAHIGAPRELRLLLAALLFTAFGGLVQAKPASTVVPPEAP